MKEHFQKLFLQAKLKSTPVRLLVCAHLHTKQMPVSAQDIYESLAKKHDIDLVTVYRTLATFEKAGIVKRVDLRKDAVFYELNNHHHHHIVCTKCGIVEDFELCEMEKLSKKVASKAKKFKTVSQHSLELFGLCNACVK